MHRASFVTHRLSIDFLHSSFSFSPFFIQIQTLLLRLLIYIRTHYYTKFVAGNFSLSHCTDAGICTQYLYTKNAKKKKRPRAQRKIYALFIADAAIKAFFSFFATILSRYTRAKGYNTRAFMIMLIEAYFKNSRCMRYYTIYII